VIVMVTIVSGFIPKNRQIRLPYKMNYIFIRDGFLSEGEAKGDCHGLKVTRLGPGSDPARVTRLVTRLGLARDSAVTRQSDKTLEI
jgi:hypothetical protein